MRVHIVLYDGFDDLDAVGPYEVLRMATEAGASLQVDLVTREPTERVISSHGLELVPHGVLDRSADLVLVPGGRWLARAEVGAWGEIQRGALPRSLHAEHARGAEMASVCTGAMLLSAAGITRGRPATTHRVARAALREEGAEVVDARVVDDGDLVTAGGVTAGIDLALWLVERQFGAGLAADLATRVEYEPRGEVHRRGMGLPSGRPSPRAEHARADSPRPQ